MSNLKFVYVTRHGPRADEDLKKIHEQERAKV